MKHNVPNTPFSTRLSGSARETELRIRNIFQWKKKRPPVILFVLLAALVLMCCGLVSCREQDRTDMVLDTKKEITAITIHTSINDRGVIPVPEEYVDELADWVRGFEVGAVVKGALMPGTGSTKVELTFVDGTTQLLDISTVERDGTRYYINAPDAPGWWMELINSSSVKGMSEIGKTYNQLRQENPDLQFQFADEINARAFCLGRAGDTLQYYFFGAQDGPSLEELASAYGDQLRCAGILSTVGEVYPKVADGLPLEQFVAENQVNDYDYYLEDGPGRGWIVFEDGGYRVMIDTNEIGADYDVFKPTQTMRHSYPILVIDSAILADNKAIQDQERGAVLETGDPLAMRSVLKTLGWENTYGLATGGAADHEIAMTREIMELFGSVADWLTSVDEPSKFSTILGGVTLWLSKDKGERINFYPSEHYPDVLVNYVTDKGKEYASVEDVTLYSFLVAAVEKKYVELHDLDGDRSFETVQWDSENNKRFLVIYDVYDGQIQRVNVNEVLDCTGSDYSGQIGNIPREYSNLAVAYTDDGTFLYRYDGYGRFTYFCTLEEALAVENRVHPLTANDEVLAHLDRFFESNVTLRAFLISGSGPLAATVDEYRSAVREVFARCNWIKHEEKPTVPKLSSTDWTINLATNSEMMELSTNSSCLTVREKTSKGTVVHYYSYYDAALGKLNTDLVALCDTPLFYYGLTILPASVGTGEALAKAYEQKFRELLLNSGIVGDYELVSLKSVSENGFEYIDLSYKVTPAHPDRFWCDSIEIDEDGRWTIQEGVILSKGDIAGEDEVWRLYGFAEEDMEWMKDHLKQLAQASQT